MPKERLMMFPGQGLTLLGVMSMPKVLLTISERCFRVTNVKTQSCLTTDCFRIRDFVWSYWEICSSSAGELDRGTCLRRTHGWLRQGFE